MGDGKSEVTKIVEKAWVQLDKNKDNVISRDELNVLLVKIFGRRYPPTYLDLIMEQGDRQGTGTIDSVEELVDAFYALKAVTTCCSLITAIDKDHDGILTKEELQCKLKTSGEYPEIIKLIKCAPLDENEEITCEEFFGHCLQTFL